jgi:hypothetical protein
MVLGRLGRTAAPDAANQVLIARFADLLNGLEGTLKQVAAPDAPNPTRTLGHIQEIRNTRLRQLLTDKELSVLAGVTVPPTGTINLVDEIEGMNRIVQNGLLSCSISGTGQQPTII